MTAPPGRLDVDVCVIGGGPAGAVLARRLAGLGHRVAVIERAVHGGAERGETLHPGAWPVLDHLGITEAVLATGARPVPRARVCWGGEAADLREPPAPQLAVVRPRLDAALLGLARAAGAIVLQPALATGATLDHAGWRIAVEHGGATREIHARLVGDASGRAAWRRGRRARTSARTFAMRGIWRGAALPADARLEALDDGWLWGAPADAGYAAMAIVDAGTPLTAERYLGLVGRSRLFRELGARARLHAPIETCDATGHAAPAGCEDRLIRLGDASYSLDPLSSAGLHAALGSALHASAALHTLLLHPPRAPLVERFYEAARAAEIARHAAWTAELYAECRWRTHPFWQRRASPPRALAGSGTPEAAPGVGHEAAPGTRVEAASGVGPEAASGTRAEATPGTRPEVGSGTRPELRLRTEAVSGRPGAPAFDPAWTHLALAPDVVLEEIPCLAGDLIEARLGVRRPAARPFVWSGGVAIAPLLAPLVSRPMTPGALLATWLDVPPARHRALLAGLLDAHLVVPVGPDGHDDRDRTG